MLGMRKASSLGSNLASVTDLTLAGPHDRVLTSFLKFNKALTKFNEALTKPYYGLIEILLQIDFRYRSK